MEDDLGAASKTHNLPLPVMLFGRNGTFAIMPTSFYGKEIDYFTSLDFDDRGTEGWSKLSVDAKEIKSIFEERFVHDSQWPELVKKLYEKISRDALLCWPFFTVPSIKSWTSPQKRIFLIGDAAHAIPPTGGQGAAMAFEDADTLTYVLTRALRHDGSSREVLPHLFNKWEEHRKERVKKAVEITTRGSNMRKTNLSPLEQTDKEWLLWALCKWAGPEGGAKSLYTYTPENILAHNS